MIIFKIIDCIKLHIKKRKRKKKNLRFSKMFKKCGNNLLVYGQPYISEAFNITIGNNVNLNDGCILNATGASIVIGDNVTVSSDAKILAASYNIEAFLYESTKNHQEGCVHIGNNVWICAGAIILPNVYIKGHCIVAAGAVITHSIEEEFVVVAGNPGHVVKKYKK